MASNSIEEGLREIQDKSEFPSNGTADGQKANDTNSLSISTSPTNLLSPPSANFRQIADEREEISPSLPSSTSNWHSLWQRSKVWLKHPFNVVILLWISCAAISTVILLLVMTGALDAALPKKSQRNAWTEVNNQILNALFTLLCLYQHPKRIHHLILLYRWNPDDISTLRKIYCKNGTYKPRERAHMMVVILLLHLAIFAQYALCGLMWGYKRSERPAVGQAVCIAVGIAAPIIAKLYSIFSPLGREYESEVEVDVEAQDQIPINGSSESTHHPRMLLEKRFSFASTNGRRIVKYAPVWSRVHLSMRWSRPDQFRRISTL